MILSSRAVRAIGAFALSAVVFSSATAADNPFAPNQVTSSDTVTWKKVSDDQWSLEHDLIRPVMGNFGRMVGVATGRKLIVLNPDGTPDRSVVALPKQYRYLGLRENYIIGVPMDGSEGGSAIEFLDRKTGKELRRASLGEGEPLSFVLHPTLPVTYVSLSRQIAVEGKFTVKGFFVAVDELKGEVRAGDDHLGQTLVVDPSGRFLVAGYSDIIELGTEIVRGEVERFQVRPTLPPTPTPRPGPQLPGRPIVPALPRGYGARPRGPIPPSQIIVIERNQRVTRAAKLSLMLLYDIEDEFAPQPVGVFQFKDFDRGLRLSSDGLHLTGLSKNPVIESRNPLDPKADPTTYNAGTVGFNMPDTDLIHHPAIPLSAILASDKIDFLDTTDGQPLSDAGAIRAPIMAGPLDRFVGFSADGKYALVAERQARDDATLARIAVPLSPELKTKLEKRSSLKPAGATTGALVPLAHFDALRGGLAPEMRASEISKRFSRTVVVVRSNEGSGTGFVVGSSGYILTCAHCVSRLTPTVVVYRTASADGKEDEKEQEAEAEIVQRDVKLDLALLKIKPAEPLTSVLLAPPVETSNGEEVTVISNPVLGDTVLKSTITTGVVSNAVQMLETESYIQSSAAVNPGSSGGPMFDQHGRAIGMVVLKAKIEGVGFAIPIRRITDFLLSSAKFSGDDGRLVRNWIDAAHKTEQSGSFVKFEADKLTIAAGAKSHELKAEQLSAGDRRLLELINTASSAAVATGDETNEPKP